MKSISVAVIMALSLAVVQAWSAETKIAVVDMNRVVKSFGETKSAESLLEKQIEDFEAEQKEMIVERDKIRKEFEAARENTKSKALSEKERESKMEIAEEKLNALRDSEMKIRERANQRQKEINDQKVRMQKRIVGKLRVMVGKYADEKGYMVVLDSSSIGISGVETVVYSQEKIDITEEVLKNINAGSVENPVKDEKPEKKK